MLKKIITPEITMFLDNHLASEIPFHLQAKAMSLNIKNVYLLEADYSNYGVYGNCIVTLNDGTYIDFQNAPNSVETVIDLMS